jgi:hypothetical protein
MRAVLPHFKHYPTATGGPLRVSRHRASPKVKIPGDSLPNNFARIPAFLGSEKDGVTETMISGPLRELYLADHHRLDPMATPHFGSGQPLVPSATANCRNVNKRTGLDTNFSKLSKETA